MKPLKTQFWQFVQWTNNIDDRIINFHIDDAFFYTIRGKLGFPADPDKDLALEIAAYVEGSDDDSQIVSFFNGYILRWWVLIAFKRFLENHGRNVTQFGYTQLKDPEGTFDPVDEIGRAVYLKRLQGDINIAETAVFLELHKKQWNFDGFQYLHESYCVHKRKKQFGISAIGHQKPYDYGRYGYNHQYGNMISSSSTSEDMAGSWKSQGLWDASSNQLTLAMQTAKEGYTWESFNESTTLLGPDGNIIKEFATIRALVTNPGADLSDQTKWKVTY